MRLRTYERPSHAQLQEVSSEILTSGEKRTFGTDLSNTSHVSRDRASIKKQNCVTVSQPPSLQRMLFGNLANCTVNITLKNFVVNINPGPSCPAQSITDVEEEFDSLVKDVAVAYPTRGSGCLSTPLAPILHYQTYLLQFPEWQKFKQTFFQT